MTIARSLLLCLLRVPTSLAAQQTMTSPGVEAVGLPWIYVLRKRVTYALLNIKGLDAGVLDVRFTVTATGQVLGVHVEGPARDVRMAAAVPGALGPVTPPHDHLAHPISVRVRIR